jgi:predicted RNase H-like HicB family nuclease
MDQMEDAAVSTYVALVDGKPGAFGVVFPDCPGCTAMGRTVEEAVANATEALADWAEDVDPMPKPRTVAQLRRDPEFRQALADGDALVFVQLVRRSATPSRRRYA